MPRIINSHGPAEHNPDFEAITEILNNIRKFWITESANSQLDPMRFVKLGLVAFTQWSAIIGVDAGITEGQFLAICQANFKEAHKRAPKFS